MPPRLCSPGDMSRQEVIGLDELSRHNLVSQKRLKLRELVTKSKSLGAYATSSSADENNCRQENIPSAAERSDAHSKKGAMSLGCFLLKNEKQSTAKSHKLPSGHSANQFLSLSLNQDLVSHQEYSSALLVQQIDRSPKQWKKSETKGSTGSVSPPVRSLSLASVAAAPSPDTIKSSSRSTSILRRPTQLSQQPSLSLEQKVIYWEIASYDPTQSFYDSDVFRFSDSSWKLILEKDKSAASSALFAPSSSNKRGGNAVFYNLLLYRFLTSTSCSHHSLAIDCEFQIHCDLKSSYRHPRSCSLPTPGQSSHHLPSPFSLSADHHQARLSSETLIFPSRTFSLSSSAASASTSAHPQYNGQFSFISSTDLLKYVKDGKLLISAELSLREMRRD
jgi:hypothetical protein